MGTFLIKQVKNDELKAEFKREQVSIHFSGFQLADHANKKDLKNLLDAVIAVSLWIDKESKDTPHYWKAQNNLVLPLMWKFLAAWNFGISIVDGYYYVIPPFAIFSDRDTQPMVKLGRLKAVLEYLCK